MEIIKDQNGWKLGKKDNVFYLICQDGEEIRYGTSKDNAFQWFDRVIEKGWTHLTRNYYTVTVTNGKIITGKHQNNSVRSDKLDQWSSSVYLTAEEAKAAISLVLPKAKEKFEACQSAYLALHKEMGFSSGCNYDGDTHGIYNEYEYISFQMDGFHFEFPLNCS
jgi:hypothetical protein